MVSRSASGSLAASSSPLSSSAWPAAPGVTLPMQLCPKAKSGSAATAFLHWSSASSVRPLSARSHAFMNADCASGDFVVTVMSCFCGGGGVEAALVSAMAGAAVGSGAAGAAAGGAASSRSRSVR